MSGGKQFPPLMLTHRKLCRGREEDQRLRSRVVFAQGVKPERFKLFQLADLICSIRLIQEKIAGNIRLTDNEFRFFGGPRKFLRNVCKQFSKKEI